MAQAASRDEPEIAAAGTTRSEDPESARPVAGVPPPENSRFYPALDGLRALAVTMVFVEHYFKLASGLNWGWAGVDIFFVLSGFLITGILYDTRHSAHRFRSFYARRALRIFPLYYTVLLLLLLSTPWMHWGWQRKDLLTPLYLSNYARLIWHGSYRPDFETLFSHRAWSHPSGVQLGHFWSLALEEQFYLVWPPLVFLIGDRVRLRNLCVVLIALVLGARVLCVWLVPAPYLQAELLYRLTPLRMDALLIGGLLALVLRGPEAARVRRLGWPALWASVAGFAGFEIVYALITRQAYPVEVTSPGMSTLGLTLLDCFAALLILAALEPGTRLFRTLTLRPLVALGRVSYGFYLLHDLPHLLYYHIVAVHQPARWNPRPGTALLAFVATILLANLSFRFLELPFLRLKRRFPA